MNKLILSILICFILFIPTKSYSLSGNAWLGICKKGKEDIVFKMTCDSYLSGLRDMDQMKSEFIETPLRHYKKNNPKTGDSVNKFIREDLEGWYNSEKSCFPESVTTSQLQKILTKWFDEHPENLHEPVSWAYTKSMPKTFPCSIE